MSHFIEANSLVKHFPIKGGLLSRTVAVVRAVDGVDLFMEKGETLGLVGESGCGKTTLGRCLLRLIEPTRGEIYYEGRNMLELKRKELRQLRLKMQMVFQDPFGSLDPRQTILSIIGEPLQIYRIAEGQELRKRVADLLTVVGLSQEHMHRLAHEFSGGQRQRIVIARALALNPGFIVLDEPTSALDVSVQAQILNLLKDLQDKMHLTYLLISHDLSTVKHMSNSISVMYLGKVVERSPSDELFSKPIHPYTRVLLSSIPIPDPDARFASTFLKGEADVPSPIDPPPGCRFHTRCSTARPECKVKEPLLVEASKNHLVACHHFTD